MTHLGSRGFRSLTTRLIAWILLCCGGVFVVTLRIANTASRKTAEEAATRDAETQARALVGRIEEGLTRVEDTTRLLAATLDALDPTDVELERLLRKAVESRPRVFGAAAAFEPGAFRAGLERYAPYVCRDPAEPQALVRKDLATDSYRYFERDWYTLPVRSGAERWSEPYLDEGGGGVRMVTFSTPIVRATSEGRSVRGVVTADLTLDWLNEAAQGLARDDEQGGLRGAVAIVSRAGMVLAARRLKVGEPLLAQLAPEIRAKVASALADPAADERLRVGTLKVEGEAQLLAWARHGRTGWVITVIYPKAQVMASVERLAFLQASLVLGGFMVLGAVVVWLSRQLTRPLLELTSSAGRLATGDLDASLPPVRSRDEIGRLTLAFHEMRDSLKAYIRDLAETTKAKEKMESELRVARRIQTAMLPSTTAGGEADGYDLGAALVPARDVGGDLYDYFTQGSRVCFLIGDVSGKGVPAALFMARVKTLFETVAARETDPGSILEKVNRGLAAENDQGMFVTVVCGFLDTATGDLVFSCGGHDAPVHVSGGTAASLEVVGGPLLGLLDAATFPVNALRLAPGEWIVLYTDGVSEAANAQSEMFGGERLVALLSGGAWDSAAAMTESVLGAVRGFAGEAPQSDDITILTLRYVPRAGR